MDCHYSKTQATPSTAPLVPVSTRFRLGNFAKSLLAEAQDDSSDLNLSPTAIQNFLNPLRSQLGLPNLCTEDACPDNDTSKSLRLSKLGLPLGDGVDVPQAVLPGVGNVENVTPVASLNPTAAQKNLNPPRPQLGYPNLRPEDTNPDNNTSNSERLDKLGLLMGGGVPKAVVPGQGSNAGNVTPVASLNQTPVQNFLYPIRPHNQLGIPNLRTEDATQDNNTSDSERLLGKLKLQTGGGVLRPIVPGQVGIVGNGTPVASRVASQSQFRTPRPNMKGKNGNPTGKKAATWKFKSETVDRKEYLILKELGKGGCGQVDLVIEKETRDLYALKKVNLAGVDETNIQECLNEIELLIEMKDTELVIRIFSWEFNPVEKTIKIVMEYGQCDLRTSINSVSSTLVGLKSVWHRMLSIVATIHSRGIVHSDLKPANFVWVGGNLKIIDFGIANRLQTDHTSIATFNPKGTMNFISPETLRPDALGRSKISPKSDIWSLGCILYMMIYGKTPFQDITYFATKINAICTGAVNYPPLPQHLHRSSLMDVLHKCFKVDPKQRPSASDLLNHPFLSDE